ncbi:chaperone protein HtpG [Fusobacterium necrophorum subsp. funduliforme ATCC 51357]|uniref:Chaperone protein HtpG n=1 Tax=Fusobacterium necrophorum subsp. funduliforme TaxID=143387 RepID=A0A162IT02_9FUSO|nr:molecular chaperone HtpG [Fusobacterium necrophorum]AYV92461.1 molecular chaperone HtpG [Fusobacterium necrophorum subsp. funduliforme]EIJ69325.1 chaperone protein HtpG [Fusobacterium necrophorum subsp. funduliforme ATCC 51357]KAB0553277.1 molecular chaperone HtpG [Fusobacterium necrophorum subsp. funduliforme]KYL04407.1 molecular chaperone HtpG [Fusobacterium necrophorum subsp. funduliforme]KYM43429.1 molecular chaperone HtpG [Fusobacterium necrophorum subsp. funduliforme]
MRKEEKIFQAETKELLNLMIHSIYTNQEIFLRELISNASDALDKFKFQSLTDDNLDQGEALEIHLSIDKEKRQISIEDNGIGMTYEEVDENIGTIAKSGSKAFREKLEAAKKSEIDIIGQFGVGFYSAFIVADEVSLETKSPYGEMGVKWSSKGDGSYEIEEITKEKRGTKITLHLKEGEEFDQFLEEWKIKELVKKYSDYIRYQIKMGEDTLNSSQPIWKKAKSEVTEEEYKEFYKSNFHDWQDPLLHFPLKVQGNVEYTALLYIPQKAPFDFYTKNFKRGLQLYTKNVFIMDKCEELIPEYFSFVAGLVDCDSLSLNISREILQQNKELEVISKNLEKKIIAELKKLWTKDRETYIKIWEEFGKNIKFGVQDMFGMNKEKLQDLLIFQSTLEDKYVSLKEYVERMGEAKEILYVAGEDLATMKSLPKMEALKERGKEVLLFTDKIDEFTIRVLQEYEGKKFKSISDSDFVLEGSEEKQEEAKKAAEEHKDLLVEVKEMLGDKVTEVNFSANIGNVASSLLSKGAISLEMEKVLSEMPGNEKVRAEKVLALNPEHPLIQRLQGEQNEENKKHLVSVLYNQARLLEGFAVENPAEFIKSLNALLK